jgi:hypothetical protein
MVRYVLVVVVLVVAACSDGASRPSKDGYAIDCSLADDHCPEPYECTALPGALDDGGTRETCLIHCTRGDECPAGCTCNGVNGQTSFGGPNRCGCIDP